MKHFTVLYAMPVSGLDEWMTKSAEERKPAEDSLRTEWDTWLKEHADTVKETSGLGTTKRVSALGVENVKNGIMLISYVESESFENVTELFKNHPHLILPGATIDIMESNTLGGM